MNVRSKLALTIGLTGLLTALGVILALVLAYERFEHESSYYRADAFLKRVTAQHTDLLSLRERFGDRSLAISWPTWCSTSPIHSSTCSARMDRC